ncbi:MAG: hypothetical protein B6D64_11060 [Bacteroidetes bacterium 4484_276]|nr:MAG: hypothetical protein B6D64_11060 [Bacteroidetes bacterium 4484_276]
MLRLFGDTQMYECEVLGTPSPTQFSIKAIDTASKQFFVFGKKTDDFRAVDYDRVFTLGVSDIQELNRQNEELQKQNIEFHARLKAIESILENTGYENLKMLTEK